MLKFFMFLLLVACETPYCLETQANCKTPADYASEQ